MIYDRYISTTLPYANSVPHIGHALEFIQADSLVKFFRTIKGEHVFFNIGVDENGLKVFNKAQELGIDTIDYLDSLSEHWVQFCKLFDINYDNFYRTTSIVHHAYTQRFWSDCLKRGDLYKKSYVGKYCTGCEAFKTDTDLVDGKCPDHQQDLSVVEEENYFFRISNYRDKLVTWFDANPEFLSPASKREELRNILLGAEDISVSRLKKNVPWGVTVPDDRNHVIYVWFEALLNYVFAVQDFNKQKFVQICGPDNLRFQGSLLQAILESANLGHTSKLLVHGTVLDEDGKKMSKSLGNVVDPILQEDKYNLDAVRYYALSGLTTYGNGLWSEKALVHLYNTELADEYGNLLSRVLHLIDIKNVVVFDVIPNEFKTTVDTKVNAIVALWESYEINQAIKETNQLVKLCNKYINDSKPWSNECNHTDVLSNLYYALCELTALYRPVLSERTISKINYAIISKKKAIIFDKLPEERQK